MFGVEIEGAVVEDGIDIIDRVTDTNRRVTVFVIQIIARRTGDKPYKGIIALPAG